MLFEVKKTGISEEVVKDVVSRTLKAKVAELNNKLREIEESIRYFERKYGMKTADFYDKFKRGAAGDDMDFFEWKALKELNDELTEERNALLAAI